MIRQYEVKDTDAVVDVWLKAMRFSTPFLSEAFLAQEKDNVRQVYLPNTETWVVTQSESVIGFTSLIHHSPEDVEVGALFVDPAFHGGGHGKALMDKVISLYGQVRLDVFKENAIGRRFYDRYGFTGNEEYDHPQIGHRLIRLTYG